MPDVEVPIATHAGFNVRHPRSGGAGQLLEYVGLTLPFPRDAGESARTSDPRPAIAGRYSGRADYLALTLALTPDTRGLIGAPQLARLRPTAVLVNVARGEVVDEDALYDALHRRVIAGAALDVWYRYPSGEAPTHPGHRPFHELPNVLMTPHCSGFTEGTADRRWGDLAANLDRFARGEPLINVVMTT